MNESKKYLAVAPGGAILIEAIREKVNGRMSAPMNAFEVRHAAAVLLQVDPVLIELKQTGKVGPSMRHVVLRHAGDPMHSMGKDKLRLEWRSASPLGGTWETIH